MIFITTQQNHCLVNLKLKKKKEEKAIFNKGDKIVYVRLGKL